MGPHAPYIMDYYVDYIIVECEEETQLVLDTKLMLLSKCYFQFLVQDLIWTGQQYNLAFFFFHLWVELGGKGKNNLPMKEDAPYS